MGPWSLNHPLQHVTCVIRRRLRAGHARYRATAFKVAAQPVSPAQLPGEFGAIIVALSAGGATLCQSTSTYYSRSPPFPYYDHVNSQAQRRPTNGPEGTRTPDLYSAIVALSRLSYRPAGALYGSLAQGHCQAFPGRIYLSEPYDRVTLTLEISVEKYRITLEYCVP